jgi:hypothetical protein
MGGNPCFFNHKKWFDFLKKDFYWVFDPLPEWLFEVSREGKLTTPGGSFPNI